MFLRLKSCPQVYMFGISVSQDSISLSGWFLQDCAMCTYVLLKLIDRLPLVRQKPYGLSLYLVFFNLSLDLLIYSTAVEGSSVYKSLPLYITVYTQLIKRFD